MSAKRGATTEIPGAAGGGPADVNDAGATVVDPGPVPEPRARPRSADPAPGEAADAFGELVRRRRVTPEDWHALDGPERLRWLVENTEQVLVPRPPSMTFRALPGGGLEGPSSIEGERGERIEEGRADLHETLRHEAIGEVARDLLAGPLPEEVRREAGALPVLLGRAAEAREAGRPRAETVSHVERLLGSLSAKLLRPDADQARGLKARLREGGGAANRGRAEAAARDREPEVRRIREYLRAHPGASSSDVARWMCRGGRSSRTFDSLRQLVGRVRRDPPERG